MKCFLEGGRKPFLQLFKLLHQLSNKSPSPYLPDFIEQETTALFSPYLPYSLLMESLCLPFH